MKYPEQFVYLQGGLGNQMFQYAFYLALKKDNPRTICDCSFVTNNSDHNGYELEKVFNIKTEKSILRSYIAKFLDSCSYRQRKKILYIFSLIGVKLIKDTIPSLYDPNILKYKQNSKFNFYIGYWQTEQYFKHIEFQIKDKFKFNELHLSKQSRIIASKINNSNSISIHIRRGDYLLPQNETLYKDICTIEYYQKGISIIKEKCHNCNFFIFSDDIQWARKNIVTENIFFIDFNKGKDSWQDMYLMSLCKHNIIANSSFSWWAAWLNNYEQKIVICPHKFINTNRPSDIIPASWIKI